MMRRWLLIGITLAWAAGLGACARAVAINPEDAIEASEHYGNIRIVDDKDRAYYAQSIEEGAEEGFYQLNMVEIVDDGVSSAKNVHLIPKASIVSVEYYENNRWIVAGALTASSLFILWLYYSINTTLFD